MKRGLNYLFSILFLFNQADSQIKFLRDQEAKAAYKNKLYIVDQYNVENEKRKHAYKIHTVNENGGKGDFIGDEESEFNSYRDIALASNIYFDRYGMIEDLSNIGNLFSKTNDYYKFNRFLIEVTGGLTRLNSEGQADSKKNLEVVIDNALLITTVNKTDSVISEVKIMQDYLKHMPGNLDVDEILKFKQKLYDILSEGYANQAMQHAYVLANGDLFYKFASIIDNVIKTVLSKSKEGKKFYNLLKELGLDSGRLNSKNAKYIRDEIEAKLKQLNFRLSIEEEQFNPTNKNSLAYQFLNNIFRKEKIENFSLKDLEIFNESCTDAEVNEDSIIFNARSCYKGDTKINGVKADLPYDFKEIKGTVKLSFDVENLNGYARNCIIGIADYETPRTNETQSQFQKIGAYKKGTTVHWEFLFDNSKRFVYIKEYREGNTVEDNFDINSLGRWNFRIIVETLPWLSPKEDQDVKIKLKNLKININ